MFLLQIFNFFYRGGERVIREFEQMSKISEESCQNRHWRVHLVWSIIHWIMILFTKSFKILDIYKKVEQTEEDTSPFLEPAKWNSSWLCSEIWGFDKTRLLWYNVRIRFSSTFQNLSCHYKLGNKTGVWTFRGWWTTLESSKFDQS